MKRIKWNNSQIPSMDKRNNKKEQNLSKIYPEHQNRLWPHLILLLHADHTTRDHFKILEVWFKGIRLGNNCTWMSWTDITEQGKFMSELTLTITVSTPSGKTYLKYWKKGEEKDKESQREQLQVQPLSLYQYFSSISSIASTLYVRRGHFQRQK